MSEQREDVPTIAVEPAKPMAYSTSTLLNEISMLRTKLKELEDDNRSTVSSVFDIDAAASIMRKELYRIEQEKADQEKQFMNQIASIAAENGAALEALRIKLKESEEQNHALHAKIAELEDQDKSKDYMELLEEECKQHALELEKMQQNIVQADIEVMESRREMDALHEKLVEAEAEKELLQHELTQLRSDRRREQPSGQLAVLKSKLERSEQQVTHQKQTIDELRREVKRKDEELTELNSDLTKVEEHKDMLLNEVSDLRKQLHKGGSASENETRDRKSELSSDERQKLEEAVAQLEERLQRLLAERDRKIEQLHRSLSDERKTNKELRKLNKESNHEQRDNSLEEQRTQNVQKYGEELKLLQNENKALQNEIKALRRNGQPPSTTVKSPEPKNRRLSPPRSITPKGKGAISGLVASFERRIAPPKSPTGSGQENDHQCKDDTRKTFKVPADLPPSNRNISDLEQELIVQKHLVFELQQQLGCETKQVDDLRRELEEITDELLSTRTDYRQKAQELMSEIENLQSRCKALEGAKPLTSQNERTKSEQLENLKAEASQLRLRVRDLEHERDELNNRLFEHIQESDKHDGDTKQEIEQLRGHLAAQHVRIQQNEDNEEELMGLREQIKTLQPELYDALRKIEMLENVIAELRQALATSSSSDATQLRELRKLISELSVEKAQIEVQTSNRIKELESEMEVIESAAEVELEEKEKQIGELQKTIESQKLDVQRLENERVELSYQVNVISASSKNEINALKDQLMDTSTRTSAQQHEIESLKKKLEEKLREEEAVLMQRDRINELEDELQALKRSIQSPVTDVDPLKQENTRLRDSIREIQKERRSLHERLDSILTDKSSSKSAQVLRDRNASLRTEVENLTQRLKKMEESITRCAV
jgi:chromosome segregation ATPase